MISANHSSYIKDKRLHTLYSIPYLLEKKMRVLICLFAILLSSAPSAIAFETCEECMEHIIAFGGLINDYKVSALFIKEKMPRSV
jgi:hypothetical protein